MTIGSYQARQVVRESEIEYLQHPARLEEETMSHLQVRNGMMCYPTVDMNCRSLTPNSHMAVTFLLTLALLLSNHVDTGTGTGKLRYAPLAGLLVLLVILIIRY